MRTNNRILKIHALDFPKITFVSNAGDYYVIDLRVYFDEIEIKEGDFGYEVAVDEEVFNQVTLEDNALAWKNVTQQIELPSGTTFDAFFHLDPLTTIEHAEIDHKLNAIQHLRKQIKTLRKALGLTQQELGERIGSNKSYISRIENTDADLELKTLRKIFEVGFDKRLYIGYYDEEDVITSSSNSILNIKFVQWASKQKDDLTLIEGIGEKTKAYLQDIGIGTPAQLAPKRYHEIQIFLRRRPSRGVPHYPEYWPLQAKYINQSDWLGLINMQRAISKKSGTSFSKIEQRAKRELKEEVFLVQMADSSVD